MKKEVNKVKVLARMLKKQCGLINAQDNVYMVYMTYRYWCLS